MTADYAKMQEIFLVAVERYSPDQWDGYLDQAVLRAIKIAYTFKLHHSF